jgi:hypothetical protein
MAQPWGSAAVEKSGPQTPEVTRKTVQKDCIKTECEDATSGRRTSTCGNREKCLIFKHLVLVPTISVGLSIVVESSPTCLAFAIIRDVGPKLVLDG